MARRVLLIVGGGIAAYRVLELVRLLRRDGIAVTPVMTQAAGAFVTPLSLEVLCGEPVHEALFDLTQESTIDHITLARSADLVLVCPATANLIARMTQGMADDLATTLLLATTAPVLVAPAMNVRMWEHSATQSNMALLRQRGVQVIGPEYGDMACGEQGMGRLAAPEKLLEAVYRQFASKEQGNDLTGRRFLVTAGPTLESVDPVRFISNHSSGIQGFAIAQVLAERGAKVVLVAGPVALATPAKVQRVNVQTALEMQEACFKALAGMDGAICVAAVSDWRPLHCAGQKIKKNGDVPPLLRLTRNPDILESLCHHPLRPALMIGFAAETEKLFEHAEAKRQRKGCDWLLVNDVSPGKTGKTVFGALRNQVCFLEAQCVETWPEMDKKELAYRLVDKISFFFENNLPREGGDRE